jgi:hypothetical protein
MNILLFWPYTTPFRLDGWIMQMVNLHLALQCGRPYGCMWSQKYSSPPDHGHLTSIEIHVGNGI